MATYTRLEDITYIPSPVGVLFENTVGSTAIKEIALFNTDTVVQNVTIYNVPDNLGVVGTATSDHIIWKGAIQPNSSPTSNKPVWSYPIILADVGDSIQAVADNVNKVTAMVLGDNDVTTAGVDITDLMLKSVYDSNNNSVVNDSELFNGQNPSFYLNSANHTGTQDLSTVEGFIKLQANTTDTTPTPLTTNGAGIGATNQLQIADNTLIDFNFIISSLAPSTGDVMTWRLVGSLYRGTGAASTVLKNFVLDIIADDTSEARDVVPTADTTNGALTLTFTGQAATNISVRATGHYTTVV